jgi:HK97 family phage prohead protease
MSADKEATTMGREKADAAIERREIISMGDRQFADALVDGVKEYGRFDQTTVQYDPQAGKCGGCIFYRGEAWDGPEACVLVAANVNAQGGCRIGIQGELPGALEDEVTDSMADPMQPNAEGEVENEQSIDDALEDVDEALQLGESDEDDEEDEEDESPSGGVNVTINIDLDNGENHNAEGENPVATADTWRSHETFFTRNATAEWRDSGKGEEFRTLQGYAAIFDSPSEDLGGFREVLAPGCFTRALESPDLSCHLLWNHDPSTVFASTRNGTLELVQDRKGLRVWARVDMQDPDAQRVVGKVRSGLVDQMSFAFTVSDEGEEWEVRDGKPWRTISQVSGLYDASVVTEPAYRATKVEVLERALRSGRVPDARASVAQDDPAGTTSSLNSEGEALRLLKARAKSRLHIVKFDLTR